MGTIQRMIWRRSLPLFTFLTESTPFLYPLRSMHANAHDTQSHRDAQRNTFPSWNATLSFFFLLVLPFPRSLDDVPYSLYFFLYCFPSEFLCWSHAKPSTVQNCLCYAITLVLVYRAGLCSSLTHSLSISLSVRAPTITLSHRRPEQKGKSMKEKYDASARKSAFILASWSTVLRFHLNEYTCTYV